MPTAATTGASTQARPRGTDSKVLPVVPFIRASAEHREEGNIDIQKIFTTSDQNLGVFDVPAQGYVRRIVLLIEASGGTGGAPSATLTEDGIWATLKNITLAEPNGAVIAQFDSGYDLHIANKWSGLKHPVGSDFKASPTYTAPTSTFASYQYMTAIPVEIDLRSGLGALPNQNAAATFKLKLTLAKVADVATGTLPTTLPTVRVRAYAETWDQPEISTAGATNQINPPAMNTTQFWSSQQYAISSGTNKVRLTRVGNYIRELIFVQRRTAGTRANGQSDWPALTTIYHDTRPLDIIEKNNWLHQMYERTGFGGSVGTEVPAFDSARGLDNGVFVYDFCHEFDGMIGRENRDLWFPTLGSTRLEVQGSWANAGSLTVITNDVTIAGSVFM